jgi:hypothetical protein
LSFITKINQNRTFKVHFKTFFEVDMMLQIINKFNVIWIVQILVSLVPGRKTEQRIVGGKEAKPRKDDFIIFPKFSFVKNVHLCIFVADSWPWIVSFHLHMG